MNERSVDVWMKVKGELEGMCVKLFGFMGGFGFGAGLEEGREGVGIGVEAGVQHLGEEV